MTHEKKLTTLEEKRANALEMAEKKTQKREKKEKIAQAKICLD